MLFSSMTFLWIFFPIVVAGTLLIKNKYQNIFLLLASLIFYAWGEPIYVILMLFSILFNWAFGILIENVPRYKKGFLVACISVNLMLLGYYKYYNFFVESLNKVFNGSFVIQTREIALPIGISFFTFQALSYVIDLYRGKKKAR